MRLRLVVAALLLALPVASASTETIPFRSSLSGSTHTPLADNKTKWRYSVRVSDLAGHLIRARVTMQIVDPLGGVHPLEFDCCKRNVVNHAFTGVFREAAEWPPESRGFRLVVRAIVRAKGAKRVLRYWVRPK